MSEPRCFDETVAILGHLGAAESPEHVRAVVQGRRLALVLPAADAGSPNAAEAAFAAGNLLARMAVQVDVIVPASLLAGRVVPGATAGAGFGPALANWMTEINPAGRYRALAEPEGTYDVCLVVGRDAAARCAPDTVWVWPNGWNLHFRAPWAPFPGEPLIAHPVVAHATGAFAASEVVRRAFAPLWPDLGPTRSFSFSLFDLTRNPTGPGPALPAVLDLGEVAVAGQGAVGSALILGLRALGDSVAGDLIPTDGDPVTITNVARYVMVRAVDVGKNKAELAAELLGGMRRLRVQPEPTTYQEYLKAHRPAGDVPLLVVAVDGADKRRALATALAGRVLNAGTDTQDFQVSHHGFADGHACLACLYYETPRERAFHERVAADLGLPVEEAARRLAVSEPVGLEVVRRVAAGKGLAANALDEFADQPLESFYRRAVCGGSLLSTFGTQVIVPLPHTSALAGSMLLLELIKERMGVERHYRRFTWSLTAPGGPNPDMAAPASPRAGCLCTDDLYREAYAEKWGRRAPG